MGSLEGGGAREVRFSLPLTSVASCPPVPACGHEGGPAQGRTRPVLSSECGTVSTQRLLQVQPQPSLGQGGGAERGQWEGPEVDFLKPGKSGLWKEGFASGRF